MQKVEFNEENKLVMGYMHYINNRNKVSYNKAIGYIDQESDIVYYFYPTDTKTEIEEQGQKYDIPVFNSIECIKSDNSESLYICDTDDNLKIFELKHIIFPDSKEKLTDKKLYQLLVMLNQEKYGLNEDFEPSEKLQNEYENDTGKIQKSTIKKILTHSVLVR